MSCIRTFIFLCTFIARVAKFYTLSGAGLQMGQIRNRYLCPAWLSPAFCVKISFSNECRLYTYSSNVELTVPTI